jgi:hypothetical protein
MGRLPQIRNPFAHRENYEDAAQGVGEFFDPRQQISDAYWSLTHPRDRVMGRGRSAGPHMNAFPLGGRWAPKTPGLRAEAVQSSDFIRNHKGQMELFGDEGNTFGMRGYNLRNEQDEIVGSLMGRRMDRGQTYIDQLYVDPKYRKTGAMMDLVNIGTHGGKLKPRGALANPRLHKIVQRRFDPERAKVLDKVAKVKAPPKPKPPTQLDRDIHQLRVEAESGMMGRQQLVNRDVGHPLTPVRRPPPPRPARARIQNLREQQTALGNELRERRRGGV